MYKSTRRGKYVRIVGFTVWIVNLGVYNRNNKIKKIRKISANIAREINNEHQTQRKTEPESDNTHTTNRHFRTYRQRRVRLGMSPEEVITDGRKTFTAMANGPPETERQTNKATER